MQLIGFCIPRIFLVTTAYNKHDIHSESRLADVMSTHQFHERKVIQPFNDFTMRILPFDLYTLQIVIPFIYQHYGGNLKSGRENANFFFPSQRMEFFYGRLLFSFFTRLARFTPA